MSGTLDQLLTDPSLADREDAWLQVTLTDPLRPAQAMERLRRRFPHTLVLAFDSLGPGLGAAPAARTSGRSDHDIACDFVADLRGAPPTADEVALLRRAIDACCDDADLDVLVSGAS